MKAANQWSPAVLGLFEGGLPPTQARVQQLANYGLAPDDFTEILHAHRFSSDVLTRVHGLIGQALAGTGTRLSFFILGSVGRFEASSQSDLDLVAITDTDVATPKLIDTRRRAIETLQQAGFDVPEKTFDRVVCLPPLTQIGGRADTNDHLTYRALLLTEAVCVHQHEVGNNVLDTLWSAYCRGPITSGRYLTALSNDLHRYYRTICLDYRHKVETGKHWATRSLKLKHSRRLWHLANLASWCEAWTAPDSKREALLARQLATPPLWRLLSALTELSQPAGIPESVRQAVNQIATTFNNFTAALAKAKVRHQLETLAYDQRESNTTYTDLYQNAAQLEAGARQVFEFLWARCRDHVFRFGVL